MFVVVCETLHTFSITVFGHFPFLTAALLGSFLFPLFSPLSSPFFSPLLSVSPLFTTVRQSADKI